jgi:hypothetical protein
MHTSNTLQTVHIKNPKLQNIVSWFPKEFVKKLRRVLIIDPVLDNNLIQSIEYLRISNPILVVTLSTTAQSQDKSIMHRLAELDCIVRFKIGGTSQAVHSISIDSDLENCMMNAGAFISKGGVAVWDMNIYKHNEEQVVDAKRIAGSLGFRQFVSKSVRDKKHDPSTVYPVKKLKKSQLSSCAINCKSKSEGFVYIDEQGLLYPCAWTGEDSNKLIDPIDLKNETLDSALQRLTAYEKSFENNNRLKICAVTCGDY